MIVTKTLIRTCFIILISFVSMDTLLGQVPAGGGTPSGGTPGCWPPPCIPIDGGIGILMAAGIAFGAKKMYDLRK